MVYVRKSALSPDPSIPFNTNVKHYFIHHNSIGEDPETNYMLCVSKAVCSNTNQWFSNNCCWPLWKLQGRETRQVLLRGPNSVVLLKVPKTGPGSFDQMVRDVANVDNAPYSVAFNSIPLHLNDSGPPPMELRTIGKQGIYHPEISTDSSSKCGISSEEWLIKRNMPDSHDVRKCTKLGNIKTGTGRLRMWECQLLPSWASNWIYNRSS